MVADVTSWSSNPDNNGNLDGIPMYEGMPPKLLNDGVRAVMAAVYNNDVDIRTLITALTAQVVAIVEPNLTGVVQIINCVIGNQPAEWLPLSGGLFARATYPALYTFAAASGLMAGSDATWLATPAIQPGWFSPGDGANTFRLPYRNIGVFSRSIDLVGATDPGHTQGYLQGDTFQGHRMGMPAFRGIGMGNGFTGMTGLDPTVYNETEDPVTDGTNGTPRTGHETRPVNVADAYFIHI